MSASAPQTIAVVGAGSWGTALAIQFARAGCKVRLGGVVELDLLETMVDERENKQYLPGAVFPPGLTVHPDLDDCLAGADDVLVVVPSHGLRDTLTRIRPLLGTEARVCWATKGFELATGKLPHQVAGEVLGPDTPVAVLSGPTFAKEVAAGLPSALTIASSDAGFARDLAEAISSDYFRAYTSEDIIGVEVGAAVKNALAIGAGMSDGLGFGANTRIALINRGLVELMRLGVALGAQKETFMGLAGMGDLVLTCTDNLSRNRRMGLALAAGKTVEEAQEEIQQVVEGVKAAKAVHEVAEKLGIEMPIVNQVYRILYEGLTPREAVEALMSRELKPESA
ncbi:MAG: NAD(P)-dependent glycerol-3-phosphate dehydrogenase [Gammaproteobacteria bacterium]|nr:NAD(P)-dependent glycerol-3-phosphate dehydrogenase [Gammaproteobacteria bacterium]NNF50647.1 NAD(P)-dependent glycerol-3-phosphate dehydrogenase [Woeseiaceae bacterium]MBT8095355.1 NAD(P)-dependent glycerol-3-phosphate dehydrogenase [Gammaproteobacteria bacterium]MBT8104122.1 NAD(P)-dependent glycerol-3-phosphate dehydrogenase [Gammaproteobacteria bacterium]NNK24137.1 NAD(P)-dependent glycerol-3-phosphate dehydrogenase [Woeseiaceae bacterium]